MNLQKTLQNHLVQNTEKIYYENQVLRAKLEKMEEKVVEKEKVIREYQILLDKMKKSI